MLGMLHKTNTITGASHLGAKPFIHGAVHTMDRCSQVSTAEAEHQPICDYSLAIWRTAERLQK